MQQSSSLSKLKDIDVWDAFKMIPLHEFTMRKVRRHHEVHPELRVSPALWKKKYNHTKYLTIPLELRFVLLSAPASNMQRPKMNPNKSNPKAHSILSCCNTGYWCCHQIDKTSTVISPFQKLHVIIISSKSSISKTWSEHPASMTLVLVLDCKVTDPSTWLLLPIAGGGWLLCLHLHDDLTCPCQSVLWLGPELLVPSLPCTAVMYPFFGAALQTWPCGRWWRK